MGTPLPRLANLAEYLEFHLSLRPDAPAVIDGGLCWSWKELDRQVNDLAAAWQGAGLRAGQRVAFLGAPGHEFWLSLLAAQRCGLVWVGLNPQYTAREMQHVLQDAAPRAVFVASNAGAEAPSALRSALDEIPGLESSALDQRPTLVGGDDPHAEALAAAAVGMVVYTSGTTGSPKGALVRQEGLVENGWWIARRLGFEPHRTLVNLPVNHIGCVGDVCASAFIGGGALVFMPGFDPVAGVQLIREQQIEWLPQVPAQFQLLLGKGGLQAADLRSLRCLMWGGAPMPRPLIEQFQAWVPDLCNSYGLSECSGTITISPPCSSIDALADTVGAPVASDRVRIVADDGAQLPPGETGEVQIQGPHLFHGYLNKPEATAASLSADGWLKTGDLGRLDADGYLRLLGRTREMFKSGGYNVYPREVESVIEDLAGVELCAVVGVPDPLWAEIGVAFVQADPDRVKPEALRLHCQTQLANYKVPKHFRVARDLPLLPIGKLDKQSLRKDWIARDAVHA